MVWGRKKKPGQSLAEPETEEHDQEEEVEEGEEVVEIKVEESIDGERVTVEVPKTKTPTPKPKKTNNRVIVSRMERLNQLDVNKRLDLMESLFKSVLVGTIPAVMVQSGPGIGKTHTFMELVKKMGLVENVDYIVIKAGVSAFGVYKQICHWAEIAKQREEEAKGKDGKAAKQVVVPTIFFDDVPVFGDKRMVDVLKALMDTYKERKITWLTDRAELDPEEAKSKGKLPAQVTYTGGVIIATNAEIKRIDKPMMDRAIFMPIQVTDEEMVERMRAVATSEKFEPEMDPKLKLQVLNWMCGPDYTGEERSMRSLVKALKLAQADPKNWRDIVTIV